MIMSSTKISSNFLFPLITLFLDFFLFLDFLLPKYLSLKISIYLKKLTFLIDQNKIEKLKLVEKIVQSSIKVFLLYNI